MMQQMADRLLIGLFIGLLFVMALWFVILPKGHFSELENRVLESRPAWSWQHLFTNQLTAQTERFVDDHFPLRSSWVKIKSTLEQWRLQQENNGIYKGKDGYLFEKFAAPDLELVRHYTEIISKFAFNHQDARIVFMLAPNSIGMYPERLPYLASTYPQDEVHAFIANVIAEGGLDHSHLSFIDGFEVLRPHAADDEPIYFRTDHHWTTCGAYWAYQAYAEQMGWQPLDEHDFEIKTVSQSFLGSYHTRSQFTRLKPDDIQIYIPRMPLRTDITIVDTGEIMDGLYAKQFLSKKDQYSYFLGGVHALLVLHNERPHIENNIQSGLENKNDFHMDKLLVIKDSYAHNFIPFLTHHVEEIHVIDIRYYNGKVSDYLREQDIKDVVFLFNTQSYVENHEIVKLR